MMRNKGNSYPVKLRAIRLTLAFLLLSTVWIIVSDLAVDWLLAESRSQAVAQTIKGLAYVSITAALVFWLSTRAFRYVSRSTMELQIRRAEALIQAITANLGEAVLMIDPATQTIISCNATVKNMLGYTPGELTGKSTQILHQDQAAFKSFTQRGKPELEAHGVFRCEQFLRHKNGTRLQTEITVVALQKELGWRAGVAIIIRDVTAQKVAASALEHSEARYRLLAEQTLDLIWAMNPDLVFTYVNPAITTMTGHTPPEFVGSHLRQHFNPAELIKLEQIIHDEILKGPEQAGVVVETEMLRKDGSSVAVEIHGKVIFDNHGNPTTIQGTTRDISHRQALEAEIRQSQKLQAIGAFASGVAHEINNPVMGILGYAELIRESSGNDPKIVEACTEIKAQTNRIHELIGNLLGFARTDERRQPETGTLLEIVESTLSLIRTVIRHDQIALKIELPANLPDIHCQRQQIQQVIMNLVTNARDALNLKYPGSHEEKRILISGRTIDKSGQPWIRLQIEDRGAEFQRRYSSGCSNRSSPPSRRARGPDSACGLPTGSCANTEERLNLKPGLASSPVSTLTCQLSEAKRAGMRKSQELPLPEIVLGGIPFNSPGRFTSGSE